MLQDPEARAEGLLISLAFTKQAKEHLEPEAIKVDPRQDFVQVSHSDHHFTRLWNLIP